jgi:hypothetical protein
VVWASQRGSNNDMAQYSLSGTNITQTHAHTHTLYLCPTSCVDSLHVCTLSLSLRCCLQTNNRRSWLSFFEGFKWSGVRLAYIYCFTRRNLTAEYSYIWVPTSTSADAYLESVMFLVVVDSTSGILILSVCVLSPRSAIRTSLSDPASFRPVMPVSTSLIQSIEL